MNFRSLRDLVEATRRGAEMIPHGFDLVVGVPRSGMIPATILSVMLDLPLADLEGFLAGRLIGQGSTRPLPTVDDVLGVRSVLVVEDSISSGRSMARARSLLEAARPDVDAAYAAVFAAPEVSQMVDLYFEACPHPRFFEWNLMNSWICGSGAFDLDGVLCRDPTPEENDDGPRYAEFIRSVPVLRRPGQKLGWIVTSRLERYRPETQSWLAAAGIEYEGLAMLDGVSAQERRNLRLHAPFKARVYAGDPTLEVFVESDPRQAREIARLSGKPVLDFASMQLISPARWSKSYATRRVEGFAQQWPAQARSLLRRAGTMFGLGRASGDRRPL